MSTEGQEAPLASKSGPESGSRTSHMPPTMAAGANIPQDSEPRPGAVPVPGKSFIIQSIETGKIITIQNGEVVMAFENAESTEWKCVSHQGFFGFRDPASKNLLGYNKDEQLCCKAPWQQLGERFHVRETEPGLYELSMTHFKQWLGISFGAELRALGKIEKDGVEKLGLMKDRKNAVTWRFINVPA